MPTRSRRTEPARRATGPATIGLALAGLALAGVVRAHEPGADALPASPGWRLGAAVALVAPHADERWPTAAWPGVLVNGSAPRQQDGGLRLEHATVDLATRLNAALGAHVAVGLHDRDSAHVETARLQAEFTALGQRFEAGLGRDTVRLGAAIDRAGHFDRFSLPPLAKRAVLNDQWIDDGASLAWQRGDVDGLRALEAGIWRGRVFPGGAAGPAVPSLHAHLGWGHVDAHLSAAHFEPEGRGAAARTAGATGHVHGSLDCRTSLQQRVCFDGRSDVLAASAQWEPEDSGWSFALAGLARLEDGTLYSPSGQARARVRVAGWWADAAWQPTEAWTLAARLERLTARNTLRGVGTALLAGESGLADSGPVERVTLAALYELRDGLQLSAEAGHERFAGGRVSHVALRAVWHLPRLLGGPW